MFIALSTTAKVWKEPKHPTADEWIKKMWFIYTVEFYSDIKRSEILPFATTWMELKYIMLSEISQPGRLGWLSVKYPTLGIGSGHGLTALWVQAPCRALC